MTRARLLLYPGMIADETLYARVRARRPLTLRPWPVPERGWRTMAEGARALVARDGITADDVVGGISLGGMMALEIARLVPVRRVVLISSCRKREQIAQALVHLAALGRWLPLRALAAAPMPSLGRADRAVLQAIVARADPRLLRWSCHAVRTWAGDAGVASPISHLHGARDALMPAWRIQPDELVAGAGHFLCLTHPHRLATFLDALPD